MLHNKECLLFLIKMDLINNAYEISGSYKNRFLELPVVLEESVVTSRNPETKTQIEE